MNYFDVPEPNISLAGYAALIDMYQLRVPTPRQLSAISTKHRKYDTPTWRVFTPRHAPENTLYGQLVFALKYEGVDLCILSGLFKIIVPHDIEAIVLREPTGRYARRIWFLYEFLAKVRLTLEDATKGNFVDLIDSALQYPGPSRISVRHRVRNNFPGTKHFCPLITRSKKIDSFLNKNLPMLILHNIGKIHRDVLLRAAAFLLLEDSKASYAIEGEAPLQNRAERWGRIIGKAGNTPLTNAEFHRLQKEVISDSRFIHMGYRHDGGFIGTHDRRTGLPLPSHISAKPMDIECLMNGLIETADLLTHSDYPAILTATAIAFGFVFIHPFEDGNGRIHRYLLHHMLAVCGFTPKGLVFPVSAVILERLDIYRQVLEAYSSPRLLLIDWRTTEKGNVEVLNDTIDFYRYFDATLQAEFICDCIEETISTILPREVEYLQKYDRMKSFLTPYIDMPERLIDLLIHFLTQNNGTLSERAKHKEFVALTPQEVQVIERKFAEIFR